MRNNRLHLVLDLERNGSSINYNQIISIGITAFEYDYSTKQYLTRSGFHVAVKQTTPMSPSTLKFFTEENHDGAKWFTTEYPSTAVDDVIAARRMQCYFMALGVESPRKWTWWSKPASADWPFFWKFCQEHNISDTQVTYHCNCLSTLMNTARVIDPKIQFDIAPRHRADMDSERDAENLMKCFSVFSKRLNKS